MRTKKIELKNQINNYKKVIAEKCLECVCCQPREILICDIFGCPLWQYRPKIINGLYILANGLREKNNGFFEAEKSDINK